MATPLAAPICPAQRLPAEILSSRWGKSAQPACGDRRVVALPAGAARSRRGDEDLVIKLLPLVRRMAWQIRERLPLHVEIDDLVSTGVLGLIDALRKFDSRRDVKLERYAQHRIRGAILDGLRGLDSASRDMRKKSRKAETAYRKLESELGHPPSDGEMAGELGVSLKVWYRTVLELQGIGMDWLRPMGSVGTKPWGPVNEEALPGDNPVDQFEACFQRERREILSRALARIPERERQVVKLYYEEELTMKEIGKRMGIDESRVSQLHSAALARLRQRVGGILRHPRPTPPRSGW